MLSKSSNNCVGSDFKSIVDAVEHLKRSTQILVNIKQRNDSFLNCVRLCIEHIGGILEVNFGQIIDCFDFSIVNKKLKTDFDKCFNQMFSSTINATSFAKTLKLLIDSYHPQITDNQSFEYVFELNSSDKKYIVMDANKRNAVHLHEKLNQDVNPYYFTDINSTCIYSAQFKTVQKNTITNVFEFNKEWTSLIKHNYQYLHLTNLVNVVFINSNAFHKSGLDLNQYQYYNIKIDFTNEFYSTVLNRNCPIPFVHRLCDRVFDLIREIMHSL